LVLLAAGVEKLRAVRAALRAGMVRRLIINKRLVQVLAVATR
jgi:DNA-binding transcriptional regulator LsrR (DeoR family)